MVEYSSRESRQFPIPHAHFELEDYDHIRME